MNSPHPLVFNRSSFSQKLEGGAQPSPLLTFKRGSPPCLPAGRSQRERGFI